MDFYFLDKVISKSQPIKVNDKPHTRCLLKLSSLAFTKSLVLAYS